MRYLIVYRIVASSPPPLPHKYAPPISPEARGVNRPVQPEIAPGGMRAILFALLDIKSTRGGFGCLERTRKLDTRPIPQTKTGHPSIFDQMDTPVLDLPSRAPYISFAVLRLRAPARTCVGQLLLLLRRRRRRRRFLLLQFLLERYCPSLAGNFLARNPRNFLVPSREVIAVCVRERGKRKG